MKKKYKIAAIALIVIISAAAAISFIYKEEKISVYEVGEKSVLKETVRETGIIKSGRSASLSPSFDGTASVYVELGDRVKKGQLIAEVDPENIENAISQINAQISSLSGQKNATGISNPQGREIEVQKILVENTKRSLDKAVSDLEKAESLLAAGGISESELEVIRSSTKDIESELRIQENNLAAMENNSYAMNSYFNGQIQSLQSQKAALLSKRAKAQMLSPFDGIITSLNISDGGFVSPQMPVADISSADNKTVFSEIAANVAAELGEGDSVEIIYETKNSEKTFQGKITRISDFAVTSISSLGLEEQKMTVETFFEGIEDIPVGYSLDINFVTIEKKDVFSIPKMCIFEKDGEDHIFKVEDGRIKTQKVRTGIETATMTEIIEGVEEGDAVVAEPDNEKLRDGTRVTY
ncbi:MAG: biotin/lipoyl-binding protein [Proteocatella sp.]|nr:biotin/lipoyl-binding protein [Proteocatella sp.]MBP7913259.1 biotin/lipoyl-binding protein [Proteocatella sp.]MBP8653760.1 biotin/lipoyl-binding protein [Proteocatella sp.]MBP9658118.1 biotin/lipoyl-binding protein [Proteocatella sp.]MBP9966251.1 biotin/lipoyl-binding protein [Proteocatella sp.]